MLDKIKVYRRSDAKEIDNEQIRIGFGSKLWLFIGADSNSTELKFELTKTDPLNKFKKEMDGWWFCEDYVVIEMYSYYHLKDKLDHESCGIFYIKHKFIFVNVEYYHNNPAIHYIKIEANGFYSNTINASINSKELEEIEYKHNSPLHLSKYSKQEAQKMLIDFYAKKAKPPEPIKNIVFYEILDIIKPFFDYNKEIKKNNSSYGVEKIKIEYSIGEDKYIKLLELINK